MTYWRRYVVWQNRPNTFSLPVHRFAPASYREQAEKALEELREKYREIKWYAFYMENLQEFYILACAEWGI